MIEYGCPRCKSADVDLESSTCRTCMVCFDNPEAFEFHTRIHTEQVKRWAKWTLAKRDEGRKKAVDTLLGL